MFSPAEFDSQPAQECSRKDCFQVIGVFLALILLAVMLIVFGDCHGCDRPSNTTDDFPNNTIQMSFLLNNFLQKCTSQNSNPETLV